MPIVPLKYTSIFKWNSSERTYLYLIVFNVSNKENFPWEVWPCPLKVLSIYFTIPVVHRGLNGISIQYSIHLPIRIKSQTNPWPKAMPPNTLHIHSNLNIIPIIIELYPLRHFQADIPQCLETCPYVYKINSVAFAHQFCVNCGLK